jgi:capsid protein
MEISLEATQTQSAIATAALAKTMTLQSSEMAMLLQNLQQVQNAQQQMLQSLGLALQVDLLA